MHRGFSPNIILLVVASGISSLTSQPEDAKKSKSPTPEQRAPFYYMWKPGNQWKLHIDTFKRWWLQTEENENVELWYHKHKDDVYVYDSFDAEAAVMGTEIHDGRKCWEVDFWPLDNRGAADFAYCRVRVLLSKEDGILRGVATCDLKSAAAGKYVWNYSDVGLINYGDISIIDPNSSIGGFVPCQFVPLQLPKTQNLDIKYSCSDQAGDGTFCEMHYLPNIDKNGVPFDRAEYHQTWSVKSDWWQSCDYYQFGTKAMHATAVPDKNAT